MIIAHDAMGIDESAWPWTPDQLLVNGINTLLITSLGDPATSNRISIPAILTGGRGRARRARFVCVHARNRLRPTMNDNPLLVSGANYGRFYSHQKSYALHAAGCA